MVTILNSLINLFQIILIMSISAAFIFGIIALVKSAAGQRLSLKNHALIWLMLIAVLVIPFSLIAENLPDWSAPARQIWTPVNEVVSKPISIPTQSANTPTTPVSTLDTATNEPASGNQTIEIKSIITQLDTNQMIWLSISLIWMAGLIVLIAVYFVSYMKTRNLVSKFGKEMPSSWQVRLSYLAKSVGVKQTVELRLLPGIQGPFVFGFKHCRIVLPVELISLLDYPTIETILMHELVHLKHRDHWFRLLQCLLQGIHWFNPLVWLAFRWQQRDSEYYCDESTVSLTSDKNRTNYAQVLLTTATLPESTHGEKVLPSTLLTASFLEINLHKRIKKVLHERKASAVVAMAAMLVVVLAGCAMIPSMTGSSTTIEETTPTSQVTVETIENTTALTGPTQDPTNNIPTSEISLPTDNDSVFVYQTIDLDVVTLVDLNSDGINEKISALPTSSSTKFDIQVNDVTVFEDFYFSNQIYLANLDINDSYIDLAFLNYGELICYYNFYYFNGEALIARGSVTARIIEGMDVHEETQIGSINFDGHGGFSAQARSKALCSWMLTENWQLDSNGKLHVVPEYYSLVNYGYSGPEVGEPQVTLLMDLPLYADPNATEITLTANKGTKVKLVQSDNKEWVQVRLANDDLAWFKLYTYEGENFASFIEIDTEIYYVGNVFDGLLMAG